MSLSSEVSKPSHSPAIILSISPRFAEQIYRGAKRIELRKNLPNRDFKWCFLFETDRPPGVTGFFRSDGTFRGPVEQLIPIAEGRGVSEAAVGRYFGPLRTGCAILVAAAHRFPRSVPLEFLRAADPAFVPPHSFVYAGGLSVALRELLLHGLLQVGHAGVNDRIQLRAAGPRSLRAYGAMALEALSGDYADIDSDFVTQLSTGSGETQDQFFTHSKICVRAFYRGRSLGYTTLTLKRGGAVKTGPTILLRRERYRSRGPLIQGMLSDIVAAAGFHKIYCTCPTSRADVFRYLIKSNFEVEAHLRRHYSPDHDELVMGKVLWRPPERRVSMVSEERAARLELDPDPALWRDLVTGVAGTVYCKHPDDLFRHLVACRRMTDAFKYSERPKSTIVAFGRGTALAALILAPKRGGSVRATPFLRTSDARILKRIVTEAMAVCRRFGRRKLTVLSPQQWMNFSRALLSLDFQAEGVLRCPYYGSGDCAVYSKFFAQPDSLP